MWTSAVKHPAAANSAESEPPTSAGVLSEGLTGEEAVMYCHKVHVRIVCSVAILYFCVKQCGRIYQKGIKGAKQDEGVWAQADLRKRKRR